jgi:hypothetical protein
MRRGAPRSQSKKSGFSTSPPLLLRVVRALACSSLKLSALTVPMFVVEAVEVGVGVELPPLAAPMSTETMATTGSGGPSIDIAAKDAVISLSCASAMSSLALSRLLSRPSGTGTTGRWYLSEKRGRGRCRAASVEVLITSGRGRFHRAPFVTTASDRWLYTTVALLGAWLRAGAEGLTGGVFMLIIL